MQVITLLRKLALLNEEKILPWKEFLDCTICKQVKTKAFSVARESNRVTNKPLDLIHLDLIGPYPNSHSKNRFGVYPKAKVRNF